jgi:hypothetical protein
MQFLVSFGQHQKRAFPCPLCIRVELKSSNGYRAALSIRLAWPSHTTNSQPGSSIHGYFDPGEEIYEVIEGELEVTIGENPRLRSKVSLPLCPRTAVTPLRAID